MTQKLIRRIGIGAAAISLAGMVHGLGMNNPVANAQTTRLRPDLNGLQLRNPGNGMIFWVDQGRIRHIVGPSVYNSLLANSRLKCNTCSNPLAAMDLILSL